MSDFRKQVESLGYSKAFIEKNFFSKKGFNEIENKMMSGERIEALICICDDPRPGAQTKTSFLRNWFAVFTDKRILFISPTLILGEIEEISISYKTISGISTGIWGGVKLSIMGSLVPIRFTIASEFKDEDKKVVKIIQEHIF